MASQADIPKFQFQEPPAMGDPNLAAAFGVLPAPQQDPPMVNYRGHGLHQAFDLRARMKLREKPMLGMWLGAFPYPNIGRIAGQAGFDFIILDWEHTAMSIEGIMELIKTIQYASEGKTAVVVRVPGHEHYYTAWLLDAGASGIIFPHTSTIEEAKAAVASARFPTQGGKRSGPPNAFLWGYNDLSNGGISNFGAMMETWGRAAVILQIEDVAGAELAEEMAQLPGVDALMVGPGDLSLDLGVPFWEMANSAEWVKNVGKIVGAAANAKIGCMMPGFMANTVPLNLNMGVTAMTVANDGMILVQGLRKNLNEAADFVKEWKEGQGQDQQANGHANGQANGHA